MREPFFRFEYDAEVAIRMFGAPSLDSILCIVGRIVVDDQNFRIGMGCRMDRFQDRRQTGNQRRKTIMRANDNGNSLCHYGAFCFLREQEPAGAKADKKNSLGLF